LEAYTPMPYKVTDIGRLTDMQLYGVCLWPLQSGHDFWKLSISLIYVDIFSQFSLYIDIIAL